MNTTKTSDTKDILSHQYRWMRAGWPLAAANIGLFATLALLWCVHPSLAQVRKWGSTPVWWAAGAGGSLLLALVFLALRRRSVVQSARHLDARLEARNRLETAATLDAATDPIARAQREETAEFLRHAPVKPRHRHLRILGTALVLAFVAHLFTLTVWLRPWQASAETVTKPALPKNIPKATIVWKTPRAETTAAPIEEVPLTAVADSTSGLKNMTLEISVNGEQRLSVKTPVDALDKAGKHPVAVSMYLDQLSVEPFDMVSYYLRAQRIAPGNLPETTSPVQFVEVKPFRDDVHQAPPGGGGGGSKELASVVALKIAQLRLLKENFLLAHTDLAHDNTAWLAENKHVGGEQNVLETKTGETVEQLTQAGLPAQIIDLLNQARPLMTDASGKIAVQKNEPALPDQGKSLALITATEKYLIKMMPPNSKAAAQAKAKPKDPFEKQKEFELKPRAQTPAGELELLAQEQERLAQDMAKDAQQGEQGQQGQQGQQPQQPQPGQQNQQGQQAQQGGAPGQQNQQGQPGQQGQQGAQGQAAQNNPGAQPATPDPNRIEGTPAERQTQISQRLGALLNGQTFDPAVTEHLQNGRDQADDALKQLDAGDARKAEEPAAEAARELRLAKQEMDKTGEQKAQEQVAAAVKVLNQAAEQERNAPQQKTDADAQGETQKAAENVEKARGDLAKAADDQQESGSAQAAQRMADFANMLNNGKLRDDMRKLHDQPRDTAQAGSVGAQLKQIADQLAAVPGGGAKTPDEIAQLIDRVERSKANLDRLAAMEQAAGQDHQGQNQQGQGPGDGQGNGPKQDPNAQHPGNGPGQGDPKQNAQGQGPGQGQQPQPGAKGEGQGHAPPGGSAPVPGGGGNAQQRQEFANQVIDDIRQEAADAQAVLPPGSIEELRKSLPGGSGFGSGNVVRGFGKIDGPLSSVIALLRAELEHVQRQHELTDQTAAKAPAAYREAVADYFEQLSRDYEKPDAPVAPAPSATPAPTP